MKTLITMVAVATCAVALATAGCSKKDGDAKAGKANKAAAAKGGASKASLVGKWQFGDKRLFQTFNSKGHVRLELPDGNKCLGSYKQGEKKVGEETKSTLEVTYDDRQKNCMSGTMDYTVSDDGTILDFGAARYKRVDGNDDSSF